MKPLTSLFLLFFLLFLFRQAAAQQKGHLFIIGGGSRPPELLEDLLATSGVREEGYILVLPMSSADPDTGAYYALRQFRPLGLAEEKLVAFTTDPRSWLPERIDSIASAWLIYLTGGVQTRFMAAIEGTQVKEALHRAYRNGATIAGTSAGAAVMSTRMLTGDERKHPEYTGYFRTIEADNMILEPGLGLLPAGIVDQHFIRRMRMNRLLTVILEHPQYFGLGIDESTAVVISGKKARVSGAGQVIYLRFPGGKGKTNNGLLGGRDLRLSVLLPGDRFSLK